MSGLFIAIAVALVLVALYMWRVRTRSRSLYDRLGGIYAIAAVVDRFSHKILDDPLVGRDSPNAFLRDWSRNKQDRLAGLIFLRTLWVASVAGGPYKFVATRPGKCPFGLENAHRKLQISPAEFDRVASILASTLDEFKVPALEKGEVLAAFAAHKGEVNTGFMLAHGMPAPAIKC